MLRPKAAAERFGVDERTLRRWAERGLIGRSQLEPGGAVWYAAADIAELIASRMTPRSVLPFAQPASGHDDWRSDPFWAGVEGMSR